MTCFSPTSWSLQHNLLGWAPQDSYCNLYMSLNPSVQDGGIDGPSGSEEKKSTPGKRRASRAGQRTVNALSATQLERKRANDREAQRNIRARTKQSIAELREKNLELKAIHAQDQQRIADLERENAYLRTRQVGAVLPQDFAQSLTPAKGRVWQTARSESPSGSKSKREDPTTPRRASETKSPSATSATSATSALVHEPWQQVNIPTSVAGGGVTPNDPQNAAWGTHDSTNFIPLAAHDTPVSSQHHRAYQSQIGQWTGSPAYSQPQMTTYTNYAVVQQHPTTYQSTQLPPGDEFQSLVDSNPSMFANAFMAPSYAVHQPHGKAAFQAPQAQIADDSAPVEVSHSESSAPSFVTDQSSLRQPY